MKRQKLSLAIILAAVLLGGCASTMSPTQMVASQRIEPHQHVQHGGSAVQAHYALGKYHLGAGRFALAREEFLRALSLDAGNAEVRNGLASAYVKLGDADRAIEQLKLAVAASPDASHLQSNLGYALLLKGSYRESAAALHRAITLDPENDKARQNWLALQLKVNDEPSVAVGPVPASPAAVASEGASAIAVVTSASTAAARAPAPSASAFHHVLNIDFDRPAVSPVYTVSFGAPGAAPVASVVPAVEVLASTPASLHGAAGQLQAPGVAAREEVRTKVKSNDPTAARGADDLQVRRVSLRPDDKATPAPDLDLTRPETRIEVSNGNGVDRMATRVSRQLRSLDLKVTRVTNADRFSYAVTRIFAREGHAAAAAMLNRMLPVEAEIVTFPAHQLPSNVDLRVVIGNDLTSPEQVDLIRFPSAPVAGTFDLHRS